MNFDPDHTLFVDDNLAVLRAARDWGIAESYGVFQPSSSGVRREFPDFPAVDALDELIPRCQSPR